MAYYVSCFFSLMFVYPVPVFIRDTCDTFVDVVYVGRNNNLWLINVTARLSFALKLCFDSAINIHEDQRISNDSERIWRCMCFLSTVFL